jgi:hypothetical protein
MATINPLEQEQVPAATPEDRVGFRTARQAQIETQVDIATPRAPSFDAYDFQGVNDEGDEITQFDSFAAAFQQNGVVSGLINHDKDVVSRPDATFDLATTVKANPEDAKMIKKYQENPDAARSESVFDGLTGIQNNDEYVQFMQRLRDSEKLEKEAWANLTGGIAGTVAAFGLDIVPWPPLAWTLFRP